MAHKYDASRRWQLLPLFARHCPESIQDHSGRSRGRRSFFRQRVSKRTRASTARMVSHRTCKQRAGQEGLESACSKPPERDPSLLRGVEIARSQISQFEACHGCLVRKRSTLHSPNLERGQLVSRPGCVEGPPSKIESFRRPHRRAPL